MPYEGLRVPSYTPVSYCFFAFNAYYIADCDAYFVPYCVYLYRNLLSYIYIYIHIQPESSSNEATYFFLILVYVSFSSMRGTIFVRCRPSKISHDMRPAALRRWIYWCLYRRFQSNSTKSNVLGSSNICTQNENNNQYWAGRVCCFAFVAVVEAILLSVFVFAMNLRAKEH